MSEHTDSHLYTEKDPQAVALQEPKAYSSDQRPASRQPSANHLFPVFLKLEKLNLLLVGGGYVASEKLGAILGNSPAANIKLVAGTISSEVREIILRHDIPFSERDFQPDDLLNTDLAIIAINDKAASLAIQACCKESGVLVNVADTPDYCDFYLSSVVQKGNLKIAISTNGKSPTIAKRIKEVLNDTFPEQLEDVLGNMQKIRDSLSGDFTDKVRKLNEITRVFSNDKIQEKEHLSLPVTILLYTAAAIFFMIAGYLLVPAILE